MLQSEDFDEALALQAALALRKIFAQRTHVKLVHGEERVVQGTLGEAVRLPSTISLLGHRSAKQREKGLGEFRRLWDTLSSHTCRKVLDAIGWYEPKDLDWEDPRSNRRPDLSQD